MGLWNDRVKPGEGAVVAYLTRPEDARAALGQVTAVRLGRYRRPFDAKREAEWITANADLAGVDTMVTGAGGSPQLDPMYEAVVAGVVRAHGAETGPSNLQTALRGISRRVGLWLFHGGGYRAPKRPGVLLYTLSPRGTKSFCCLQP